MPRIKLVPIAFGLGSLISIAVAQGQLKICNPTAAKVQVAVGSPESNNWYAEGWFNLAPQQCGVVVTGPLSNRYYYYYARAGRDVWTGDAKFCVGDAAFKLLNAPGCQEGRLGFRKIDTGGTASYTFNLKQNESTLWVVDFSSDNPNVIRVPTTRPADPPLARWRDPSTGLTWRTHSSDDGLLDLKGAKAFCEELEYGGFDDWRLPSIVELATVVDQSRPDFSCKIKPNFVIRGCMVWSATLAGPGEAWLMLFDTGTRGARQLDIGYATAVCVRG